jgi:hypothetical protein
MTFNREFRFYLVQELPDFSWGWWCWCRLNHLKQYNSTNWQTEGEEHCNPNELLFGEVPRPYGPRSLYYYNGTPSKNAAFSSNPSIPGTAW